MTRACCGWISAARSSLMSLSARCAPPSTTNGASNPWVWKYAVERSASAEARMSPGDPVVVTNALTKKYGEFMARDGLSLVVDRGQIMGFIGPNGAGKTTTIKILVGLARPTSGSATIAGVDCARGGRQIKRLVGYMPDTFGSYDNMRVSEYLDFFGAAFGLPRRGRASRIDEV